MAVGGIVILAAGARLLRLEQLPALIDGDEGEFGAIALSILRGEGPSPFGVAFLDGPALYTYALVPFVAAFGAIWWRSGCCRRSSGWPPS
jgi:hypothetical protein